MVGLLTKRVPAIAAKLGLLFGMSAYILFNFVIKIDIHFFHLLGILFVLNVVFMLLVGHFYPQRAYEEVYTEQVDIQPWSLVKPVAVLIALGAISMYVFLAQNVPTWLMSLYYLVAFASLGYIFWAIGRELFGASRTLVVEAED